MGKPFNAFPENSNEFPGMTLRDYFAAKVLAGLMADPNGSPITTEILRDQYATLAYQMADAMLKARWEQ